MITDLMGINTVAQYSQENLALSPAAFDEEISLENYTKIPISRITALGTAFEPIASAINKVFGGSGATTGLYKVTIPSGTHLAEFKNGAGNLGTALNANNQIAGQAVLNPFVCNPAAIFMAAALASIDRKLDAIQELQQEMMDFLVQKERAESRGNLIFLADILKNYRYNWNNDMYKNSNHIKVLDIRQAAEQKILFYRDQISSKLKRKSLIHSDKDAKKQIDAVQSVLQEYKLALYTHSFSSFLDVVLAGNFSSEYLSEIKRKIESYSFQYRELYTKCYDQLEEYSGSSIQSNLIKGIKGVSNAAGKVIAKVPAFRKRHAGEALIETGSKLDRIEAQRTKQHLLKLVEHQSSCVRSFVENIEILDRLYNHSLSMVFDNNTVYWGYSEENFQHR